MRAFFFFWRIAYFGGNIAFAGNGEIGRGFCAESDLRKRMCSVTVAARMKRDMHVDQKRKFSRVCWPRIPQTHRDTDSSGCYLQRLHCDSRGQRRARKSAIAQFAIAQFAVAQSDREHCLSAAYQSALSACDIGFHSKLRVSPLCRVFCQRAQHPCNGGILSAITVYARNSGVRFVHC